MNHEMQRQRLESHYEQKYDWGEVSLVVVCRLSKKEFSWTNSYQKDLIGRHGFNFIVCRSLGTGFWGELYYLTEDLSIHSTNVSWVPASFLGIEDTVANTIANVPVLLGFPFYMRAGDNKCENKYINKIFLVSYGNLWLLM